MTGQRRLLNFLILRKGGCIDVSRINYFQTNFQNNFQVDIPRFPYLKHLEEGGGVDVSGRLEKTSRALKTSLLKSSYKCPFAQVPNSDQQLLSQRTKTPLILNT